MRCDDWFHSLCVLCSNIRKTNSNIIVNSGILTKYFLIISSKFKWINQLLISPEFIKKSVVFWWFQGNRNYLICLDSTLLKYFNCEKNSAQNFFVLHCHASNLLWRPLCRSLFFHKFAGLICNFINNRLRLRGLYIIIGSITNGRELNYDLNFFRYIWNKEERVYKISSYCDLYQFMLLEYFEKRCIYSTNFLQNYPEYIAGKGSVLQKTFSEN